MTRNIGLLGCVLKVAMTFRNLHNGVENGSLCAMLCLLEVLTIAILSFSYDDH